MIYSLAPMEGLTGYVYRRANAATFGELERYYAPFVAPPRVGTSFGKRTRLELDPANNEGLNVIPQLLTKNADEFVWAGELLADMGYAEVNLNLGCPSKTVVAKGKGSGFLRDLDALRVFLEDVCERSPLPVSVKTRIGVADDAEFECILELYKQLPLVELIVHPRVQKDFYRGKPRWEAYGQALERLPFPVAYNGDIFSIDDVARLTRAYPQTRHIMIGRGLLSNPALVRELHGGEAVGFEELRRFHDLLFEGYRRDAGDNAVFCIKEWWFYVKDLFADPLAVHRAVRETRAVDEYLAAVDWVFQTQNFPEQE